MNDVVLFERALRVAVPTQPDPRVRDELVPRLAQVARTATIEAETRASRRGAAFRGGRAPARRTLVARVGIVVGLIPLVFAALAGAGVTVPGPARDAFDSVGITLPNQPADRGQNAETIKAAPTSTTGTKAGNDVSTAAHSKAKGRGGNSVAAHERARNRHEQAKGKALGHTRGKAIGLNDLTPPGHSGQTGPSSHSNAGGSARSQSVRSGHKPGPKPHSHPFPPNSNGNANGRLR